MASTYENSLRLELIATGEAASTWGDKTNDNLTAIAAAFGYATQDGFAADANATTTVADGAADPARALYFKITSSATLTATRTLTIAPNTISRVMWIENATTGSQSIAISQGSGANVTIPAGKTAVVYLDGAGAGASVVDAMASLNIDGSISAGAATFSGAVTADAVAVNTTLKTWDASTDAIQLQSGSLWNYSTSQLNLGQNEYYNGAYKYLTTGAASTYNQASGGHFFKTAVSGIADGAITWVDVLGLSATGAATFSGNVGINTSSPTRKLDVNGSAITRGFLTLYGAGVNNALFLNNTAYEYGVYTDASNNFNITDWNLAQTRLVIDTSGNVGIGTSSPSTALDVSGAVTVTRSDVPDDRSTISNEGGLFVISAATGGGGGTYPMLFKTAAVERLRIDASGNLGLGVTPTANNISKSISLVNGGSIFGYGSGTYITGNSNYNGAWNTVATGADSRMLLDGNVVFSRSASASAGSAGAVTESMRIDISGNLLVGKTTDAFGTAGIALRGTVADFTRDGGTPINVNRLTSDGSLIDFHKAGTTVGSIGVSSSIPYFASSGNGVKVIPATAGVDAFAPCSTAGANRDNVMDCGFASSRWDDIYATNGTIQTSDRNEKQDIEELSAAETAVAVACKGLLRKFRWIDSVEEKGDDARIHFGIIAQDLQAAFAAEGLDAGRYAMFISSTWWETQTEVEAVEAVEGVEAKDAYTRTDTFQTLADAPEGATERTRLGVRYPELLAFIIAAI